VRLLVLSEHYLPLKGGHVVWLHEVCKRWGDVWVVTAGRKGLPPKETVDGVCIRRVRMERWAFLRPESLGLYASMLAHGLGHAARLRPSAILASRVLPEGLLGLLIGRSLGVPTVVFAHGEEITTWGKAGPRCRRKITGNLKKALMWWSYGRAARVIANSTFTAALLRARGIDDGKIEVVNPGTDPDRFRPTGRDGCLVSRLGIAGKRAILTVGRLTERKGQDMTIRALPAILSEIPNVVYLIAGTGPYEASLRRLTETLGLNGHVLFLGEIRDEMLPQVYNLADVFVMPNRRLPDSDDVEGFGIVFLEAAACRLPVVAGRTGGVPDAVLDGRTGILVDADSPAAIAEAVVRILRDAGLARAFGEAGRERVLGNMTWEHSARGVRSVIESVAAHG